MFLLSFPLFHSTARAADLVVDASGAAGPYTTIEQAMSAALPGDRILVLPGSYPAFQFSRGVSVIGLGALPSDVTIARVDFHVSVPTIGYHALLSNVSVCGSGPADSISIGGNELGPGTFVMDGVSTCGGVFLHGVEGFSLLVHDSSVHAGAGYGFGGAAFDVAGDADIVSSEIAGWDASTSGVIAAGVALRVWGGSSVRLSGTRLAGGNGDPEPGIESGAAGIDTGGPPLPVQLRLAGESEIRGGAGAGAGAGGDGVRAVGTILEGAAIVNGGPGSTPGAPYGLDVPTLLAHDPELALLPELAFAAGATYVESGDAVTLSVDPTIPGPHAIAVAFGLQAPAPPLSTPLAAPALLFPVSGLAFVVPGSAVPVYDLRAHAQGTVPRSGGGDGRAHESGDTADGPPMIRRAARSALVPAALALAPACAGPGAAPAGGAEDPDPTAGEVSLPAAGGWRASLVADEGETGIWTVAAHQVFEQYGSPEVVGLDDEGRCLVLVSYSGKWTPLRILEEGEWLGGLAHADVDPRAPGRELYVGGKKGNVYQIRAYRHGALDARLVAHLPGREVHTIAAGDLDLRSEGAELLVFTRPGGLFRVSPTGPDGAFETLLLEELDGRVRDAVVLPGAGPPEVATVSRSGRLALLRVTDAGPEWRTLHEAPMGMGRIALRPSDAGEAAVLYSTLDDGHVLRHERGTDGDWRTETILRSAQGPRGVAAGRFHADPELESIAVFGYSGVVELVTRREDGWEAETIFEDRGKGHWLSAAELDGRNDTAEILGSGYGGRIFLLSRPPR